MLYAAIATLNPEKITVFEGKDMAELATTFARANGGHYVLDDEAARIPVYSGKAYLSRHDGDDFWAHVMWEIMEPRDNEDYWFGADRGAVVAQAEEYLAGEAQQ